MTETNNPIVIEDIEKVKEISIKMYYKKGSEIADTVKFDANCSLADLIVARETITRAIYSRVDDMNEISSFLAGALEAYFHD